MANMLDHLLSLNALQRVKTQSSEGKDIEHIKNISSSYFNLMGFLMYRAGCKVQALQQSQQMFQILNNVNKITMNLTQ